MENTDGSTNIELEECLELCFPDCEDKLKPFVGQIFNNLDEGHKFYEEYAAACGFISRKSTVILSDDGSIQTRYVLCNMEGVLTNPDALFMSKNNSKSQKRKRTSCKVDCMARIVFQIAPYGHYRVRTFNEGHTHKMVSVVSRHLMSNNRKVDNIHQLFIQAGIKANIGPMRTFRMYKEIVGSYDLVGCTSNDFKNYVRDLKVYTEGSDDHMLLDAFKNKKELCDRFQYFYDVDDENQLCRLIWTGQQSVNNYKNFGEAVSFDATYNINRYKMIFTPFTVRDNHGKCVSFGVVIISREDMDSYAWVMKKFTECFGNALRVFMTNQDPSLRKVVALVWPQTYHKFCMWHITMKVAEKLHVSLRDDSEFKINFGQIVWSDLYDPLEFEENWRNLIDEYELSNNRRFSDMFDDHSYWIPAYFRDISMSGLFRTTLLSESENSYFKRFLNKNADLVLLYMNYNSALDAQRHTYHKLTLADETGVPSMVTRHPIERHASTVYTNTVFKEVQSEIEVADVSCIMSKMDSFGEDNKYVVDDNLDGLFTVIHDTVADYLCCKCNLFIRKGLLCRHIYYVLRTLKVNMIPEKYIANRWCKFRMLSIPQVLTIGADDVPNHSIGNHQFFKVVSDCIGHVNGDDDLRKQLLSPLTEVENRFGKLGNKNPTPNSKEMMFLEFYGSVPPEVSSVLSPNVAKTKGSGAGGRRKSNKEKAMILAQKPMRNCKRCNMMGHHDSRNCPSKDLSKS